MSSPTEKFPTKMAGKPYRPSNGSEGEMFQAQWCYRCERDRAYQDWMAGKIKTHGNAFEEPEGCKILSASMLYEVDDEDYPPEWVHDDEGFPMCAAFIAAGKPIPDPPDPNQLPLFEEE